MKRTHLLTLFVMALSIPSVGMTQVPTASPTSGDAPSQPGALVEGNEPKYVAPNTLDRIGRIWAAVKINGKGPFRLVLDTSANSSAIIPSVADRLGIPPQSSSKVRVIGVTGSAMVETVNVNSLEVGDIDLGGGRLPVVADVFGGAEGVLGPKSFADKRIYVDFHKDLIRITKSAGRLSEEGFTRVPVSMDRHQLLSFDVRVGGV